MTRVDTTESEQPNGQADLVSRRRLLRLAGGTGLAAIVSACSSASPEPSSVALAGPGTSLSAGAPPKPVTPPVTLSNSVSDIMLCRDSWGARPARAGGIPQMITRMTVHHTATVLGDNRNITTRLRQHQRYHQDQLGWVDIAYHAGVDRDGNIFELRTPDIAGDTATDYDPTGHFLVVCEGHFDEEKVSEAQLRGAALAFAWAAQTYAIPTDTLAGHRDVASATSCPGADLYAHVASGGLKRRVDDFLAAGKVDLQPVCGSEAAAIVAAIESGRDQLPG